MHVLQEEDWEADMESQRSGMEQVMLTKATELFTLCDTEGKVRQTFTLCDTEGKVRTQTFTLSDTEGKVRTKTFTLSDTEGKVRPSRCVT